MEPLCIFLQNVIKNLFSGFGAKACDGQTNGQTDRRVTDFGHLPKVHRVGNCEHKKPENSTYSAILRWSSYFLLKGLYYIQTKWTQAKVQ